MATATAPVLLTKDAILAKLSAGEMNIAEAKTALNKLEGAPQERALYCKVSPKGALSVYGTQRMPVTQYVSQWKRLLAFGEKILAFAEAHKDELKQGKNDNRFQTTGDED